MELESPAVAARVGAFNPDRFEELRDELVAEGVLKIVTSGFGMSVGDFSHAQAAAYGLTLRGWSRYENETQGKLSARYGFIALKFNDGVLDDLITNCIKPAVLRDIGYQVVDIRNVAPTSPRL